MADAQKAIGKGFTKKVAGMPIWAWGGIALVAAFAVYKMQQNSAANSTPTAATYSPVIPNVGGSNTGSGASTNASTSALETQTAAQYAAMQSQLAIQNTQIGELGGYVTAMQAAAQNQASTSLQSGTTSTNSNTSGGLITKQTTQTSPNPTPSQYVPPIKITTGNRSAKVLRFGNPQGQTFTATNYKTGVNEAGGYYKNHKFIKGRYIGNSQTFTPTKTTKPAQKKTIVKARKKA